MAYERRHPNAPWLTEAMTDILASWLKSGDRGFEWGSGRSTSWFARRVSSLVSVEHDPVWYQRVKAQLDVERLRNVDYRLCTDERGYAAAIESVPPETLDFIIVDGIARAECALSALDRLRPSGALVLDNSNWFLPSDSRSPNSRRPDDGAASDAWAAFERAVENWRCIWTSNGVTDTALWIRPPALPPHRTH